ncbi:MAG: uncharacterized protein QOK48_45, partial [Blastocatellia bacterium]|nr:uncharacterized protein [Blastocatellia bacterium]
SLFRGELADAFAYSTSEELVDDLERLEGNRLAFLEPEIAETTGDFVCLPERLFVPLSVRVIETLDSELVRRLATITQLALCYHVYPGASYTRKEHVLGAYYTTCRLLRQLILDPANPLGAMILKAPQQRLAMVATLLHDMSHVPLMHEFEDSVPELSQRAFTAQLLAGAWGGRAFATVLQRVLKSWDVKLEDLCLVLGARDKAPSLFGGEPTQKEAKEHWERQWDRADLQLVRSIMDGSVDADKIDYLQRDALHVGVRFGHGVDAERIETQMTTVIETEGSGREALRVRCRMGAWRKGQAAAESLIGVRHSMYSQVYAHRTVRAARSMLNYITWKWRTSSRYTDFDGEEIARDMFEFASYLKPTQSKRPLFDLAQGEVIHEITPKTTDNLPYNDSRVIRWMAFVSGDESAAGMAEALVSRDLYKNICSLEIGEAEDFMRTAFPKRKNVYLPTRLSARQWLSLIDHLSFHLEGFLSSGGSSSLRIREKLLPPLLLDVAIPKTMRTQSELSIVQEVLATSVTWSRVIRVESGKVGVVPGAVVGRSPVYEAYGGGPDDSLAPVVIRLFARGDLAPDLRPRVDSRMVASWLGSFRPRDEDS